MNMNAKARKSRARPGDAWIGVLCTLAAAGGLASVAGCGPSSSMPPAYCSDRASLQNSIKGLTRLNASAGISGLEAQVGKVEDDAGAVASSARVDFPSQTSALKSAVDSLESAVRALVASPSAVNIANVTRDAENVVTSAASFVRASSSKCS
jgi:hypothetical protein